jgi:Cu(I)/Ag(I) efflux system protein CusF
MRKLTTLVGGVFMMLALNVQAAEMQHDSHGQMMDMSVKAEVIQGTGVVKLVDMGNDSNLLIVFYVQIMPDDFVMQLHRF